MIRSFGDRDTERIFKRYPSQKLPPGVQRSALRKLVQLDAAANLHDLAVPPGNRPERLLGNRRGQWSIRINDQWRICFHWASGDADDVVIVDNH